MVLDLDALEQDVDSEDLTSGGMTLAMADNYVGVIKQNNEDIERYKEIYKEHVEELKAKLDAKIAPLEQSNERIGHILNEFAKEQKDLRTTKTKHKLELLSGTIEIKRESETILKPKAKVEEKLRVKFPEFVKEEMKVTSKFDWAGLKDQLYLQDGKVFHTETKEDLTKIIAPTKKQEETKII